MTTIRGKHMMVAMTAHGPRTRMVDHAELYLSRLSVRTAASTMKSTRTSVLRFARWWDSTRKVPKNLRASDVERYLWAAHACTPECRPGWRHYGAGLRESMGEGAFNMSASRLRKFLEWCWRNELVRGEVVDPAQERVKPTRRRRLRLDAKQLVELYEGAPGPYERIVCALAAYTGGRGGELNTLRLGDVDLGMGVIRWTRHKLRQDDDALPIMAELADELRLWREAYEKACGPLNPGWFLIPQRRSVGRPGRLEWVPTARRVSGNYLLIKPQLARVLGVPAAELKGEGVHTVRRSLARALYEQLRDEGEPDPIAVVQALLGHATRAMTERYIGVESGREARDRLLRGRSLKR